jgi:hypothetical protein
MGPCLCGDPCCRICGTAQGTYEHLDEWEAEPLSPWVCDQCGRSIPEGVNGCYNPYTGDDDCDGKPVPRS